MTEALSYDIIRSVYSFHLDNGLLPSRLFA